MHILDRYCSLMFDEISLHSGFHYHVHKQIIFGFEDLRELGRSNKPANHALVLIIRGLRKPGKQVDTYYFSQLSVQFLLLTLSQSSQMQL